MINNRINLNYIIGNTQEIDKKINKSRKKREKQKQELIKSLMGRIRPLLKLQNYKLKNTDLNIIECLCERILNETITSGSLKSNSDESLSYTKNGKIVEIKTMDYSFKINL